MWPFGRKRVKPLQVSQEDGFIDLEFGIVDAGEHEGLTTFAALARHDSQTVGLNVDVRGIGPPRELSPGLIVTPTLVTLRSTGDVSDRLLQLFHDLELARRREGGPPPEIDDDESYFEWYLNIDPNARTLKFVEKDEEYRETILAVLSGRIGTRPWSATF